MEEEIFRFFHVRQRFQGEHTFRDLNLSIKKGEIHCIAGLSAVEREYFLRLFLDGFGKTGGSIFIKVANYRMKIQVIIKYTVLTPGQL